MAVTHGDSPTRHTQTHSMDHSSAHVANSRMTLMRDIPGVAEVSLDALMDVVLPSVAPSKINEVCDQLRLNGQIEDLDGNPRWKCLPKDPKASGKSGTGVFKFLEKVVEAINKSCSNKPTWKLELRVTGETTPLSHRRNTSRPDGYFHWQTTDPSLPVKWADIIMPMEFKNADDEENKIKDYAKVMWSMHHVMRTDARRRYVHGLTCENTTARLWYNDRSDVVASKEFDINKNWRHLVRIILSILLATDAELGYDPNVVALPSNDPNSEPVYDITIHNSNTGTMSVYRTVDIISGVGVGSMVGRGTRVWKARRVENGEPAGPFYALKVIWVHSDRLAEDVLLKEIKEKQPSYSQYFLTPVDHGYAPLDPAQPSILFDTHKPLGREKNLKPTGNVIPTRPQPPGDTMSNKASSASRNSVGHPEATSSSSEEGYRDSRYLSKHPRQTYIIVFKEIGKPVHDLCHFTDVFTAIRGGWEGLHVIHLCEYVHRDVSSGNILLVPASGDLSERGVIMDLEYVKKIEDTKAPDVRMGTEAFMATEVALMRHHRLSDLRSTKPQPTSLEDIASGVEDVPLKEIPLPPFRHNPLHDMESIWWLCTWMIFYLVPSQGNAPDPEAYRQVFRNPALKRTFLCQPGEFGVCTSHLSELRSLVEQMQRWLSALNNLYFVSYKQQDTTTNPLTMIKIDSPTILTSYQFGQKVLQKLHNASRNLTITFVPLPIATRNKPFKKTASLSKGGLSSRSAEQTGGPLVATNSSDTMPPPKKRRTDKSNYKGSA